MFAALVALTLANAPTAEAPPKLVSGPITMKMSEVRAYNRTLARDHPNYIRCNRLLKILHYMLPVDLSVMNEIPPLSILREFLGGNTLYLKHEPLEE